MVKDWPYLADENTGSHGNSEVHECVLLFHSSLIWPNLSSGSGSRGGLKALKQMWRKNHSIQLEKFIQ